MRILLVAAMACSAPPAPPPAAPADTGKPARKTEGGATPRTAVPGDDLQLCAGGDDDACLRIEERTGEDRTISEETLEYFSDYSKNTAAKGDVAACLRGDGLACGKLGDTFAAAGGDENHQLAHRFHRLACVQNYTFSCNNLTAIYGDDLGETVSRRRFARDCERTGDADSCFWAGVHMSSVDGDKADGYRKRSCDAGHGMACYDWANSTRLYESEPGRFAELMETACEKSSPEACELVKRPQKELRAACKSGDAIACAMAAHRKKQR